VRELVDEVEHPDLATIMPARLDEIIRPHVITVFWMKTDAAAVVVPDPPPLGFLAGTFSPARRQICSTRLLLTNHPAAFSRVSAQTRLLRRNRPGHALRALAVKDSETTASAVAFLTAALAACPFRVTHV
jgi:hypothetical protein